MEDTLSLFALKLLLSTFFGRQKVKIFTRSQDSGEQNSIIIFSGMEDSGDSGVQ